ncbi:hypothetical protein A5634_18115 [Mycobacterium asiaticum]|uniref:Serine recombinase n=1 Tax=Mycobacterium asiaticum TaxID=1790 RepID=A0A1A3P5K4_MYCAS|nr:recombinase family protein [Mycobacterium asiaticum]OBK29523.1 hypothetical protein A5634_18115 [Mycobacterium asiaticum]
MAVDHEKPRRAGIYVRISQDSTGKKAGVERQLKECKTLARRLKWRVVDTYDDNDISAYSGSMRPGFEALLDAIEKGRIDAIVCWHPDRLYRRVKDLQRLLEMTDAGVVVTSVNGGELDLSTATGKMVARILGSVAEQESEHKGERRRAANLDRAIKGAWRADGPRVFGYTQGGNGEPGEPVPDEAKLLVQAAEDVLNNVSLRSIAVAWNQRGLRTPQAKTGKKKGGMPWSNLSLRRTLMRPVYAGLLTYTDPEGKRQLTGGDWEPLWTVDIHEALVQVLTDPERRPASRFERKYLGSGIYVCGVCGDRLYANCPRPGRFIYRCRKAHLGRTGAPIDEIVEAVALSVLSETNIVERLVKQEPGIDTVTLRAERTALEARKAGLAELFAEGVLDGNAVRRESEKLGIKIAAITTALTDAARRCTAATLLVDGPEQLRTHWAAASPDIRGKVVDELMTVTVNPQPDGWRSRGFDPSLIVIEPRS